MTRRHWFRWPGITAATPLFLRYAGQVQTWRLVAATAGGGLIVLLMGRAAHSGTVGYGYGGLFFLLLAWPLMRTVGRALLWSDATVWQTVLLVIASVAMGHVGTRLLGFNPQAGRIHHLSWPQGQRLLWQFPLVLPVENLILLGGLVALWQLVKPRTSLDRILVAMGASLLFGVWHVPVWGLATMIVIGLTVLPWTLYLLATGDMLAPVLAHIILDALAVIGALSPTHSLWRHFTDPVLLVGLLVSGLAWSLYREWRERHHPQI